MCYFGEHGIFKGVSYYEHFKISSSSSLLGLGQWPVPASDYLQFP